VARGSGHRPFDAEQHAGDIASRDAAQLSLVSQQADSEKGAHTDSLSGRAYGRASP
jgi:hypothetical protein